MSAQQRELVILLIGPSGSGKSSFVKSLTTEAVRTTNSEKPCTIDCKAYKVEPTINGHRKTFILIDTPGFVDSPGENLKILKKIAEAAAGFAPSKVFGAIYFHNIGEVRMKGTSIYVLEIFKAICGDRFYPHVAFVTTMWDNIKEQYYGRLQITHDELEAGPMKLRDAPKVFKRLRDDGECSEAVLEHFARLAKKRPTPPQLHLLKEFRGSAGETAAGRQILKESRSGPSICCAVM
ncbi:P-loop containing nucleoside triphosphate hydrolase protein [Lasiosphaeris hirsuta]|uniref:P-loop containing nucleoside triphosphate hydrolase protein n=1 Tax=Lasiosphaeris hirsuta TaxID=260670 RepID=A0AA40DQH2_9PEZI|nr:P-loop containing nucleoside triphosphate hydrolase protein [Lasiosphaeris hirsuta]